MLSPRDNALLAYKHKQPEYVPCFFTDINLIQAHPSMERYTGHSAGKDGFGVEWTYEPHIKAPMPTPGKIVLKDITDWESVVKFPDLDVIDWEKQAEIDTRTDFTAFVMGAGIVPFNDGHSIYDEDKLRMCMVLNGMFERMHALMGFEKALLSLAKEPDACGAFFSAVADFKINYIEKIAKFYDMDVINAHDDFGTYDRLMMSPDTWRRLIKPHLKRIVEATHDCGLIYQHHSCGFIEPLFPDFVDIGIDAIDTLQACNTNLGRLKKEFGNKITFCGGFDNVGIFDREGVTTDEIKNEYQRVIDLLAPGGSYVAFPITLTLDFVPAFLEKHFEYGMRFYTE
jgi:hypothetical protein